MKFSALHDSILISIGCLFLVACGGGGGGGDDDESPPPPPPSNYSVGGAVTGLSSSPVVLRNNGGDALTVNSSGEFSFATPVAQGSGYSVTVTTQPNGKTCEVSYGGGTVGGGAVENIAVSCVNSPSAVAVNGTNTLSSTHKPTLVGVVIDSVVVNLNYDGPGSLDGATNLSGQFNYQPGELITFKIGDIALPTVTGKPVVTLFNFAGTNDINNTTLTNIARFLQSLDSDGNPDNGITISAQAHTAAAGQSLNFSSGSFDAAANPIIAATNAAGGTPNSSLISGSTAIAHVQSTLDNLPKQVSIAGAWTTGSGLNMRALILLENGWYYGIDGNCAATSRPTYEYGSWAYSGSTLTLAVSKDEDIRCGLNTGSRTATLSGNSLTLNGATWTDVSYSQSVLSGLYAYKGFIGGEDDANLTLLTDTQFIWVDFDNGDDEAGVGTYTWGGNSSPTATFNDLAVLNGIVEVGLTSTIQRSDAQLLDTDSGFVSMHVAVRPAKLKTTLPGLWYADDEGGVTSNDLAYPFIFTSDGKYMYLGNDPACPGIVRSAAGEIGTYAWDATTGAFRINNTGDSNGICGNADEINNTDMAATVAGNLITFKTDADIDGGTIVKPSATQFNFAQSAAVGIWKQTAGSGALTLLISQPNTGTLTIKAIDSDCPQTGTAYAVESLDATISAPNNMLQATASTNYDTAACGLPTTIGPTYSVVGDTLTLGGVGTFIRQ